MYEPRRSSDLGQVLIDSDYDDVAKPAMRGAAGGAAAGGAAMQIAGLSSVELHLVCISLVFISTICCGWVLVYLQSVLKPFVFAIFLAYLLAPAVDLLTTPFSPQALGRWLTGERAGKVYEDEEETAALVIGNRSLRSTRGRGGRGDLVACPHSLAVLVVLSLTSMALILLVNLVVNSVASLDEKFPTYKDQALRAIEYARTSFSQDTPMSKALMNSHLSILLGGSAVDLHKVPAAWLARWVEELPVTTYVMTLASMVLASMQTVAIVLLFAVFLMLGWRRVDGPEHRSACGRGLSDDAAKRTGAAEGAMSLADKIDLQVRRYIVLKSALSALVGISVGLTLGALNVDLAFLFGLFSVFANYIPNVGAVVATLLPLPVVCLDPEMSFFGGALAILLPLLIHMVIGNVIEPKVFGMGLALHPVVVLFTILLWAVLWGVGGMIVSVPLTAVLRIVLKEVKHPYSLVVADILEGKWLPAKTKVHAANNNDSGL